MDDSEQGDDMKDHVKFGSHCIFRSFVTLVVMGTLVAFSNQGATAQSSRALRQKVVTKKSNTASAVPFVSLGYGDSLNVSGVPPTLLVAGTPAQAAHLTKLLYDQNVIKKIQGTDFNRELVIAVIRGTMASGGYSIRIQRIEGTPKVMRLIVKLTDPAPRQFTQQLLTEPYHVIRVPRSSLVGTPGIALAVYTAEGKVLAQIKHP